MQGKNKDKKTTEFKNAFVREKREKMGLTVREFAELLELGESGERTVRGWESGEHTPSPSKWKTITALRETAPFRDLREQHAFRFIDLFAGIGGIRIPFQEAGGKCVFTSEWDKFAKKTYAANFGEVPSGDITAIDAKDIPDHDILLGGFPCQAFSQAGLKRGFADTRGTMFFEIHRILAEKKPKAFLLENVKQLKGHSRGETLKTILSILRGEFADKVPGDVPMSEAARKAVATKLNYWVDYRILRAGDFGVPQNRERLIIVGFLREGKHANTDFSKLFTWPEPPKTPTSVGNILEDSASIDPKYTLSKKLWKGHQRRKREHAEKGNGFGYSVFNRESPYTNTISARYYKDGSEILIDQTELGLPPRKLTPFECSQLQGFPPRFIVDAVSDTQIYKQFGNSVAVPMVRSVCEQMVSAMRNAGMIEATGLGYDDKSQMKLTLAN